MSEFQKRYGRLPNGTDVDTEHHQNSKRRMIGRTVLAFVLVYIGIWAVMYYEYPNTRPYTHNLFAHIMKVLYKLPLV